MKCKTLTLLTLLSLLYLIPLAHATVYYNANTYPFTFPTYGTAMGFNTNRVFTTAYRLSNIWYFTTATVMEIGFQVQVANLLVTDFFASDSNKLYFTVTALGTSTTKIQVGTRGNATSVIGATSWNYDSGTQILSIDVLHSSSIAVTVTWTVVEADSESPINFFGTTLMLGLIPFLWIASLLCITVISMVTIHKREKMQVNDKIIAGVTLLATIITFLALTPIIVELVQSLIASW